MRGSTGYLSKREQQIMGVVFARDGVTAVELCALLPGEPSNATVRKLLRILEEKGHLTHTEREGRYVYTAVEAKGSAARQALDRLVDTFFRGSVGEVVATLLRDDGAKLTPEEIARLEALIEQAKEGR